ncbi:hypothetical protein B0A49_06194 [Cryomyces minteri]|uniref:Uncharacterized protein n=1 Tax=Cryomyces minteri TaxID=331657 RepID=A0A4U0WLQ6_9PEZI|nr:hypothetical protein B0A49_06194 [Cryomyces minteri]
MEVTTTADITSQILTNAQVLYASDKDLKVVTSQVPSGLLFNTCVVAYRALNPRVSSDARGYKVIMKGPGEKTRRAAMMKLLEETEKRVSKEVVKTSSGHVGLGV